MPLDTIFAAANALALAGWLVLLLGPVLPAGLLRVPQLAIPLLLALAYVVLVLTSFGDATGGGFSTLDEVALLFSRREVLLAGWLHFLAFDLLVGAWIAADRVRSGLPYLVLPPCLALTFLLGPAGFLLYAVLKWTLARPFARA